MSFAIIAQRVGLGLILLLAVVVYGLVTFQGRGEAPVFAAVVSNVEPVGERYTPEHYVKVQLASGDIVVAEVAPSAAFPFKPGTMLRVTPRHSALGKRTYFAEAPARR
jgi:hypothetical protein